MHAATASSPATRAAASQELVRFLLARVDEDETQLKRLLKRGPEVAEDASVRSMARLQAEAASKRRLIGSLQQLLVLRDQPCEKAVRDQATQMLRALALPYESHPKYRVDWGPAPH